MHTRFSSNWLYDRTWLTIFLITISLSSSEFFGQGLINPSSDASSITVSNASEFCVKIVISPSAGNGTLVSFTIGNLLVSGLASADLRMTKRIQGLSSWEWEWFIPSLSAGTHRPIPAPGNPAGKNVDIVVTPPDNISIGIDHFVGGTNEEWFVALTNLGPSGDALGELDTGTGQVGKFADVYLSPAVNVGPDFSIDEATTKVVTATLINLQRHRNIAIGVWDNDILYSWNSSLFQPQKGSISSSMSFIFHAPSVSSNVTETYALTTRAGLLEATDNFAIAITNKVNVITITAGAGLTGGGTSDAVTLNVGAGSGINVSSDAVALETTFTDGRYVNEGQANSISSAMVQDETITAADIATNAVGSSEINAGAVTSGKIATSAVGSSQIADYSVGTYDLATGAVTGSKIATGAVGSTQLADYVEFGSTSSNGFVETWSDQSNRIVTWMASNTGGGGFVGLKNNAGKETISLTGIGTGANEAGFIAVRNASGVMTAWMNGADGSKHFSVPDPQSSDRLIVYTCIEGPEAAIYIRGQVQLVNGRAFIAFPEHFSAMAVPASITITLTPRSADSKGLAAIDVSAKGIQVAELASGKGSYHFDYVAFAARKGFEDYKVYRSTKEIQGLESVTPVKNK